MICTALPFKKLNLDRLDSCLSFMHRIKSNTQYVLNNPIIYRYLYAIESIAYLSLVASIVVCRSFVQPNSPGFPLPKRVLYPPVKKARMTEGM